MGEARRYFCESHLGFMVEDDHGDYVKYEDYARLEEIIESLKKMVEEFSVTQLQLEERNKKLVKFVDFCRESKEVDGLEMAFDKEEKRELLKRIKELEERNKKLEEVADILVDESAGLSLLHELQGAATPNWKKELVGKLEKALDALR